jgi:hypothetical protein
VALVDKRVVGSLTIQQAPYGTLDLKLETLPNNEIPNFVGTIQRGVTGAEVATPELGSSGGNAAVFVGMTSF